MAITITLGYNNQDPRTVAKVVIPAKTVQAELKQPTDSLNPVFILDYDPIINTNITHVYVEEEEDVENRYYFIQSYNLAPGGKMELHCHEDVLTSFGGFILDHMFGTVERTEDYKLQNSYITDPEAKLYQYTETWTHVFPYTFTPFSHIYLGTVG